MGTSLVMAALIGEFGLRLIVPAVRAKHYHFAQHAVMADPERGYKLTPNKTTIMTNGFFQAEVAVNSLGLRDLYDEKLPSKGLVALGDSQTFGHGVDVTETWVEQLQQLLGVNVVNAGVFGYGLTQYGPTLDHLEGKVPIQHVLLGMTWNDVFSPNAPPDQNTVVDGWVVLNPRYRPDLTLRAELRNLSRHSAILTVAKSGMKTLLARTYPRGSSEVDEGLRTAVEDAKQRLLFLRDKLRGMGGAKLTVVYLSSPNYIRPKAYESYRVLNAHPKGYVAEVLRPWAAQQGIGFVDTQGALEAHFLASGSEKESVMLPVDGHYNGRGNAVIAREVYAYLSRTSATP